MVRIPFSKKIMFLGYGAVAKCAWNYFPQYFTITPDQAYLVDKTQSAFYGPGIVGTHQIAEKVDPTTFESLLDRLGFNEGDVVLDLTFASSTYFFIHTCLMRGLHYMNTSIEDASDIFHAGSIDHQQQLIKELYERTKKETTIRSCVLTEFGQNPGLIQHYVLHALNRMYKMSHPLDPMADREYRKEVLTALVDEYKIGTIFMSERDQLRTSRPMNKNTIYNTWSSAGFISEALDCAEVVHGLDNPYIQPRWHDKDINHGMMKLYAPYQNNGKEVLFLKENGMNSTLQSISPIWVNGSIHYDSYRGSLIHHGESFELANYFGRNAPFMSYVYQYSPYMKRSLTQVEHAFGLHDRDSLMMYISSRPDSFSVMDNIDLPEEYHATGFDSIGCTILCGDKTVERIFWCGTILSDDDPINPNFTPTIVQVAAGVLSGLSYIMEKGRKPGYYQPCDLDTLYVLQKAMPLLGTFFFTEIDHTQFQQPLVYRGKPAAGAARCSSSRRKKPTK